MADDALTPKPLTNQQRAFVEHYLTCWQASEAARRAGYSPKTAAQLGYQLLQNPSVSALVRARLDELAMSSAEVLVRMTEHARGSLRPFLRLTGGGDVAGFDLGDGKPVHLLKRVTRTERTLKDGSVEVSVQLEAYDAQAALVKLGEHRQLWGKVPDVLKQIDLSKLAPEQLERISQGEDALAVLLDK